jgi:hypothetical protein
MTDVVARLTAAAVAKTMCVMSPAWVFQGTAQLIAACALAGEPAHLTVRSVARFWMAAQALLMRLVPCSLAG